MSRNALWLLLFAPAVALSQQLTIIDSAAQEFIERSNVPSLAVGLIKAGEVLHLGAYGVVDVEDGAPASIDTPYSIASVSKVVIATEIFKLAEQGLLAINDDVSKHLPFKVVNPNFPEDTITIHELLNHRSGLIDDLEIYGQYWFKPQGDSPIALSDFLENYLVPGGENYRESNFNSERTFRTYSYSNTGYALLGLVIESVVGTSLEDYSKNLIFSPFGMSNTSWFLSGLDASSVAKTYYEAEPGKLQFMGFNGYPDYPAGQLRSSISDFTAFIQRYLNHQDGSFFLSEETVNSITPRPVLANEGFYTWQLVSVGDRSYYRHTGSDVGARTVVLIDVERRNGLIIFSTSETSILSVASEVLKANL